MQAPTREEKIETAKKDLLDYIEREKTGEEQARHFAGRGRSEFDMTKIPPQDLEHMLLFYHEVAHRPQNVTPGDFRRYEEYFQGRDALWDPLEPISILDQFIRNALTPYFL